MSKDLLAAISKLVECVKLQQQLIFKVYEFCDASKEDKDPIGHMRYEALKGKQGKARDNMRELHTKIEKAISQAASIVESKNE